VSVFYVFINNKNENMENNNDNKKIIKDENLKQAYFA